MSNNISIPAPEMTPTEENGVNMKKGTKKKKVPSVSVDASDLKVFEGTIDFTDSVSPMCSHSHSTHCGEKEKKPEPKSFWEKVPIIGGIIRNLRLGGFIRRL